MTLLSRLMALFPVSVAVLFLASVYALVRYPHPLLLLPPIFVLYFYPVLMFRLLNLFKPLREGRFDLSKPEYDPWWGSHQFQVFYFACPFLEALLRIMPGCYSAWLRLWGAKIGKQVYWTPNIEVDDRPLLEIGDYVVMGHKVHFISHVILPFGDKLSLYVKKISVGSGCFVGAGSRMGPGVVIDPGTKLPMMTDCPINTHITAEDYIRKRPNRTPADASSTAPAETDTAPTDTVLASPAE